MYIPRSFTRGAAVFSIGLSKREGMVINFNQFILHLEESPDSFLKAVKEILETDVHAEATQTVKNFDIWTSEYHAKGTLITAPVGTVDNESHVWIEMKILDHVLQLMTDRLIIRLRATEFRILADIMQYWD